MSGAIMEDGLAGTGSAHSGKSVRLSSVEGDL